MWVPIWFITGTEPAAKFRCDTAQSIIRADWGPKFRSEPRQHFFSKDPPSITWSPLRNRAVSFWKKLMDTVMCCSFCNVCILQTGESWPEQSSQRWSTRRPFQRCEEMSALVRCPVQWLPVTVFAGGALINSLLLTDPTSYFSLPCILYLVVLDEVCRHLKQWLVWGLNQQRSELRFKVFSDFLLLLVPSPLDLLPAWNAGMKRSLKLWSHGLFPPVVPSRRNPDSWISNSKAKVREKITVPLNNERKYQEIYFLPHPPPPPPCRYSLL